MDTLSVAAAGPSGAAPTDLVERLGIRRLLGTSGFRQLLASRFAAQWGDGVFQAGLGGAVLFNPERQADPVAIAAGLAVLLLPYSLVGPFAGALLDRWDRGRVGVAANLLRGALIALVALAVGAGVAGAPLYIGALLVTGASRFVLAGLSASVPHVLVRRHLVEANALAATVGAAVAVFGGMCAIGLRAVVGPGDLGSAWVTAVAVLGSVIAAAVAAGFRPGRLGPDATDEPAEPARAIAGGLRDGLAAAVRTPSVAAGMVALAAHRLSFGIASRYSFTSNGLLLAGIAGIGQVIAVGAAGMLLAAVLTPLLVTRFGRGRTIRGALLAAGILIIGLGLPMTMLTMLTAAFTLAAAGQVIKLSLDAAVQGDVGDEVRGRVFALYDTVFNVGFVLSVGLAAAVVPPDGRSPALMLLAAAGYLIAAALHSLIDRSPAIPAPRRGDIPG